jgi:NAD(P)-dependent dehydrogenase (short-subunit alcohol dehydrogenase family)
MLCRDVAAAQVPCAPTSAARSRGPRLHVVRCDLASLASVRACRRRGAAPASVQIGLLINNAGMVSSRHRMSVDGYELTFASNHLGPFLLTALLLQRLSESARIINVASRVHYRGRLELDRIADPRARYSSMAAYAQSKLANVLHAFALARRYAGTQVCVNCLHPGVVATNLLPPWLRLVKPLISRVMFDAERGARTSLYLALSNEVTGVSGRYFDENQLPQAAAPLANDPQQQQSLWQASARWCGVAI